MISVRSASLLALPLLGACSNMVASTARNCGKDKAADSTKLLALTEGNATASLPGGLLVFDKLDAKSYAEKGYDKASFAPNEKCSASFEVRSKEGRYFARFATTEDCYMGFFRVSRNQRLLLNIPGTSQYMEAEPKDDRFDKAARYLKLADGFTPAFRENEYINFAGRAGETNIGSYFMDVKGRTRAEVKTIRQSMCFGAAIPTPEHCLWPNEMHFDEVEIEAAATSVPALEALALRTQEALTDARTKLAYKLSVSVVDGLFLFSERMGKSSQLTDKVEAVVNISRFLGCNVSGSDPNCAGIDRVALDRAGIAIADIYAPDWKERAQQAALATTDRSAKITALFTESMKEHAEGVLKPYFGPAFETYVELRNVLASNKDLLGIATNYVDPTTGNADALAYRTLSPSAPELAGITLDIDDKGNVLLTHPGKEQNRNLTLDGHRGSVVTFGGLPLLPFDPLSIDQSDRASQMPLPRTTERADVPTKGSAASETSKRAADKSASAKPRGC
jgi:hypothetical protein